MPRVRKNRQVGYRPKRETALKAARLELKRLMDILCAAAERVEEDDARDRVPSPSPSMVAAEPEREGTRPDTPPTPWREGTRPYDAVE
jgi:hypothetical protein